MNALLSSGITGETLPTSLGSRSETHCSSCGGSLEFHTDTKCIDTICAERDALAAVLEAAREVHEKYKHLDALLTDKQWLPDTFLAEILLDSWRAIRAIATLPEN
jgi:hypothetical protein